MDSETAAAVERVRTVIQKIRAANRRYVTSILSQTLKTVLPGSIVLMALAFLSNYVIGTINATFGNRFYTSAAIALTFLVAILTARAVWRWADRRFKGWTLIRTIGQVNSDIRQLERTIETGYIADPEGIARTAQAAWESYVAAMQAAGFDL
jgi:hypothetical protein